MLKQQRKPKAAQVSKSLTVTKSQKSTSTRPRQKHCRQKKNLRKPLLIPARNLSTSTPLQSTTVTTTATATTTTTTTTATTTLQTDIKPNLGNPIAHIMLYINDVDFKAFNARRNAQYSVVAPNIGVRLYQFDNDYSQQIPQTILDSGKTLAHLAGQIQTLSQIPPDFISFSTTDQGFGKLYFPPEKPHQIFINRYSNPTKVNDFLRQDENIQNPNHSGIPPTQVQFSKLKTPIIPTPFFNNPLLRNQNQILDQRNPVAVKTELLRKKSTFFQNLGEMFGFGRLGQSEKRAPLGQTLTTDTPPIYNPNQPNIPLHHFTPLFDLIQVKDLQAHVSYTTQTIEKSPKLKKFIENNPELWTDHYNDITTTSNNKNNNNTNTDSKNNTTNLNSNNTSSQDPPISWKTMKYSLTPHNGMLETNHESESPVSPRLLIFLAALYGTTALGLELYEQYGFESALQSNPDITKSEYLQRTPLLLGTNQHSLSDISQLQFQRETLLGKIESYDRDLHPELDTTLQERIDAYKDGAIHPLQVVNPWKRLPQTYIDLKNNQVGATTITSDVLNTAPVTADNGSSSTNNNNTFGGQNQNKH